MGRPTGFKCSPETIAKIRAARLGKKHSPETIAKMRAAKLPWLPPALAEMYRVLRAKIGAPDARRAVLQHAAIKERAA